MMALYIFHTLTNKTKLLVHIDRSRLCHTRHSMYTILKAMNSNWPHLPHSHPTPATQPLPLSHMHTHTKAILMDCFGDNILGPFSRQTPRHPMEIDARVYAGSPILPPWKHFAQDPPVDYFIRGGRPRLTRSHLSIGDSKP